MQVALTDHIDRSQDKLLLRGKTGSVHSWVWRENDRLPSVVYVKFEDAEWQLEGIDEPGVYPICPVKRQWYLDAKRKQKVLSIARTQLPLTPAYAMTAHTSQGKTLPAVLLDLNVDKRVDITFGTVAASRVRSREDVLILRPFPAWLYQRGAPEGPCMLLQTLRGEEVDWQKYREARAPQAECTKCRQVQPCNAFSFEQWEKVRSNLPAICLMCQHDDGRAKKRKLPTGAAKHVCTGCKWRKVEHAFPRAQLTQNEAEDKKLCLLCLQQAQQLECAKCQTIKDVADFHSVMITMPTTQIVCKTCQARKGVGNF